MTKPRPSSGRLERVLLVLCLIAQATMSTAQEGSLRLGRVTLHAHNCFPEEGRWTDRIDRALGTFVRPIAIEQDVVWYVDPASGQGRAVLAHGGTPTGKEPTLEDHFFKKVAPIVGRALKEQRRDQWPLIFLHFNFRDNDPAFLANIWELLGKYEPWLTTAERGSDASRVMPLTPGPVMALTENGQEAAFYDRVPVGGRLRVFGTLSSRRRGEGVQAADVPVDDLIPGPATNYARWMNFPWAAVERGGQPKAEGWSKADAARLRALVDRAHAMGLMIRFYTLNGHARDAGKGWSDGYNFGSIDAVRPRWRAAIDAGVDLIATDQYEMLAEELKASRR
jgi:hypothetical protein